MSVPKSVCPPDHKHGETRTCYTGHRCRCEVCREANAAYARQGYKSVVPVLRECERCGVQERVKEARSPWCRDCRETFPTDYKTWKAAA